MLILKHNSCYPLHFLCPLIQEELHLFHLLFMCSHINTNWSVGKMLQKTKTFGREKLCCTVMQLLITCTCIYNGEMTATKKNNQVEIKNKVALLKKPNSLFNFITKDTLHISSKNYY